jgi:hypothetical protein
MDLFFERRLARPPWIVDAHTAHPDFIRPCTIRAQVAHGRSVDRRAR